MLTLCMLLTLLPVVALPALATGTITELFVGGTSVIDETNPTTTVTYWKSDGAGGITSVGASSSDYKVKYDPTTSPATLTLNGLTISESHTVDGPIYSDCGIYTTGGDLKIVLVGANVIKASTAGTNGNKGIVHYNNSDWSSTALEITSESGGSLSISGVSEGETALNVGIHVFNAYRGSNVSISGSAAVEVNTGTPSTNGISGVFIDGSLTIEAGASLASTAGGHSNCLYSEALRAQAVTVNGALTVNGGEAGGSHEGLHESQYGSSYGVRADGSGGITVNAGGSLTATSGTCHESGESMAVYAYDDNGSVTVDASLSIQGAATKDGTLGAAICNPTLHTIVTGEADTGETIARRVSIAPPPAVTDYNVWVGGVQVTSANKGGVTGAGISGTISFDPTTTPATLMLSSANITGARDSGGTKYGIYSEIPLDLALSGNNTITGVNATDTSEKDSYGLYLNGADLTVSGTGKLTASGGAGRTSVGVYVYKGDLTVKEYATLDGTGGAGGGYGSYGVRAAAVSGTGGVITVSGTLNCTGGSASAHTDGIAYSQGINAGTSLTLNAGSSLTARGSYKAVSCPSITTNDHGIRGAATTNGTLGAASISSTAEMNTIVTGASPSGETIAKYVSIAPYSSWVGDKGFNYTDETAEGTGWTWSNPTGTLGTLTLSGVNVTTTTAKNAIRIAGAATIVLEGANKVTANNGSAIYSGRALTIEGSGTLEASGSVYGITIPFANRHLTINSGYITVSGATGGIYTYSNIIVNGGYIEASSTNGAGICIDEDTFFVYGGYVKAASTNGNGVECFNEVIVSGGYLEASGANGIVSSITNSGGVVKATGSSGNGIEGDCSFTGGVTIASGTGKALVGTITGQNGEGYYTSSDGTITSTYNPTEVALLIVAKSIAAPAPVGSTYTLDGHYIYKAEGSALYLTGTDVTATVTGGSYLKSGDDTACYVGGTITVGDSTTNHPTLVCEAPANTKYALQAKAVDVKANGTLYGCATQNGYGIYTVNNTAGISSAGQLIGVGTTYGIHTTTGDAGVASTSYGVLSVTGGYVCGNGIGNTAPIGIKSGVSATGGYISAVGTGAINSYALDAQLGTVSVTGAAALTAVNTGNGKAYYGPAITGVTLTGAASKYGVLGTADIATNKVLLIKFAGTAPTITTTTLGDGTVGSPFRTILQTTGTAPITWSVTGDLPAGLALDTATGVLSGTPTAAGTAGFTVTATNAAGSDTQELTLTVSARPSPGYTPPAQTVPIVGGDTVSVPVTVSSGTAKLEPTDAQLDAILAKSPKSVDIDLSGAGSITSAQLPSNMLEALKKDEKTGLSIELPTGSIILAADAVTDLAAQTGGASVTFTFALGASPVDSYDARLLKRTADTSFDIGIAAGGKAIRELDVKVEVSPDELESLDKAGVYTIDENGNLEYVLTYLNGDVISFYPPHFSPFYIVDFPFTDVSGEAWFNEDVAFAKLAGLFEGTSNTTFSPEAPMTRAMLVTVLWRLAGEPAPNGANAFNDVSSGQ